MMLKLLRAALTSSVMLAPLAGLGEEVAAKALIVDAEAEAEAGPSSADTDAQAAGPSLTDVLRPLSADDVKRYQRLFDIQEDGRWKEADQLREALEDDILDGHVMFQRYMHPTDYRSAFWELRNWLADYADHPGASRVYRLALRRRPASEAPPRRPVHTPRLNEDKETVRHPDFAERSYRSRRSEPYVRRLLARGQPTNAYRYLNRPDVVRDLTRVERDRMLAWVARSYRYYGKYQRAYDTVKPAAARSGEAVPETWYQLAMAAWLIGEESVAASAFDKLSTAEFAAPRTNALGGFWAARAYLEVGQFDKVTPALERAAAQGFSFYGLLAGSILGREAPHDTGFTPSDAATAERVMDTFPTARRAAALVQVGKVDLADAELALLYRRSEAQWADDLLKFAAALGLPATQFDIAEDAGGGVAEALYPLPSYAPGRGFTVEPALIYAIMRQESRFRATAVSRAGARGLMQIMPRTASFIAQDRTLAYRSRRRELNDPDLNLDLAQKYLEHLHADWTQDDLIRTLVAYNAGPGNLRNWLTEGPLKDIDDPLLFIEMIPFHETRHYAKAVLRNYWIYRGRLAKPEMGAQTLVHAMWPQWELTFTSPEL